MTCKELYSCFIELFVPLQNVIKLLGKAGYQSLHDVSSGSLYVFGQFA